MKHPRRRRFENPEPQIELRFAEGTSPRQVSAALHRLAAEIELATLEQERWVVQMESFYGASGRVWLELADGSEEEAERGMAVLARLVG